MSFYIYAWRQMTHVVMLPSSRCLYYGVFYLRVCVCVRKRTVGLCVGEKSGAAATFPVYASVRQQTGPEGQSPRAAQAHPEPTLNTNKHTHTTQPHILDGKSNKKLHNLFHSVKFVFCSVFLFDSLDSSNNEFRCDEPVCLTLTMAPNWGFYYCCMFVYSLNINNCFTLADCCQKCWKMKILLLLLTTLWRWKLWSSLVSRMNEVTFSPHQVLKLSCSPV